MTSILETLPNIAFQEIVSNLDAQEYFRLRRCSKTLFDKCNYVLKEPPTSNVPLVVAHQYIMLIRRPNGRDILRSHAQQASKNANLHCKHLLIKGPYRAADEMIAHFRKLQLTAEILVLENWRRKDVHPEILRKLMKEVKARDIKSFSEIPDLILLRKRYTDPETGKPMMSFKPNVLSIFEREKRRGPPDEEPSCSLGKNCPRQFSPLRASKPGPSRGFRYRLDPFDPWRFRHVTRLQQRRRPSPLTKQ